ncbi:major facilitator superfamily domain-containing protein [Aspergillus venezuelensis]
MSKNTRTPEADEAARFLTSVGPFPPMTPEQEKKLVCKIDRWMIPLVSVDKVQVATGTLYGFKEDNNIHGQQYSWLDSTFSLGMVLRFLMGVFEAVIIPGSILLISAFWKRSEQPIRNGIIMTVFSSIVNGFFSWVVGRIPEDAPLARWQYLYLLTESVNVLYSLFMLAYLSDSPMNARFLTTEERWHAVQRPAENRTGIGSTHLIINNLGYDAQTSALLSMPNGVISLISGFAASYFAAKWQGRRTVVVMMATLFPLLGTALAYGLPRSSTGGQMFRLYMMYYGNLINPQTFRAEQAPAYTGGTIAMLACYCTAIVLMGLYFVVAAFENRRKDKKYGKPLGIDQSDVNALVEVYQDLSDEKQPDFRYSH